MNSSVLKAVFPLRVSTSKSFKCHVECDHFSKYLKRQLINKVFNKHGIDSSNAVVAYALKGF